MLKVLKETVSEVALRVNMPTRDFAAWRRSLWHVAPLTEGSEQTMNQQHADNGTETDGQLETAALWN